MPELRQNMATKEWVIIATERAERPDGFVQSEALSITGDQPTFDPTCPFCPGNEELDLEIECWPERDVWQTRVVHNKFPALSKDDPLTRKFDGVHRWISGAGHHEIVVDHPKHNTTWALMAPNEIHAVLEMFQRRGWSIREDERVEQVIYFKNHGHRAGASLKHTHSQIIALPIVPTNIRQRLEEARRYFDDYGQNVFRVMVENELGLGERILVESKHFVAFVLYAAPAPFHTWIIPRQQSISFLYAQPEELADLAEVLVNVLRRLYFGLRDPSYNLIIRSAPVKEISNDYYQWYITIVPRLSYAAGFELGSGMFINPTLPEGCADFLRKVKI